MKKLPKDRRLDRHRPGYWAEYKRKWRARKKAEEVIPKPLSIPYH